MNVALYARVSKDEKFDDNRYQEPENQLAELRPFCAARGWEVTQEYVDRESGKNPNREQFLQMRKDAYKGCFSAIVVWKLDRFSRESMSVQLAYLDELRRSGVGVISLTESWCDTRKENPVGELLLGIMAWMASEELRKISERTRAGIARRRAIGQYRGGRPRKCKTCLLPISGNKRPLCACGKMGGGVTAEEAGVQEKPDV